MQDLLHAYPPWWPDRQVKFEPVATKFINDLTTSRVRLERREHMDRLERSASVRLAVSCPAPRVPVNEHGQQKLIVDLGALDVETLKFWNENGVGNRSVEKVSEPCTGGCLDDRVYELGNGEVL